VHAVYAVYAAHRHPDFKRALLLAQEGSPLVPAGLPSYANRAPLLELQGSPAGVGGDLCGGLGFSRGPL